jgi:ribosomal protein L37AE/L43A
MITLFIIIILAITIVGLLLAIPLLLFGKTQENVAEVITSEGIFIAKFDKSEWKKLSKYVREPTRDEINCPQCAEKILAKAKVCKHCGAPMADI